MDMHSNQLMLIVGVVVVIAIAAGALILYRKQQSRRLRDRFGAEYGRAVEELGSRASAESELKAREQRVKALVIVALTPAEGARFTKSWGDLQKGFVDDPKGVVVQADQLVRELMLKRGYPMADFAHRSADISVDHPDVVLHYRAAQAITERSERGEASTEELRKAVVHYRALFDELLEIAPLVPVATPAVPSLAAR
jgi:hypothetical protein